MGEFSAAHAETGAMQKHTVAVVSRLYPSSKALLESAGATIVGADRVGEANAIMADGHFRIDAAFLDTTPHLKVVGLSSVGYDAIDVEECARRGVPVSNCRGTLTETTADLTWFLVLAAMRNITAALGWVRSGSWMEATAPFGVDVEAKTLGIVGMGAIGSAVAKRARASGMQIIYHNRRKPEREEPGARYVSFDELLGLADCIVVLIPLSAQSRGMFGRAQFEKMKSSAYFVNAARGPIADTQALYDALVAKKIAGAALDVTDPEPLPPDHPLLALPNVFITPHIGSATPETRERMSLNAAQNIVAGLRGEPLLTPIATTVPAR